MKLKAIVTALALLLSTAASAWSPQAMNETIDQTNFLVNDSCSGTLIDKSNGYILTAHHCIRQQYRTIEREEIGDDGEVKIKKIRVAAPGAVSQLFFKNTNEVQRNSYTFSIKGSDRNLDLAVLQVSAKLPNTKEATLACNEPVRGDVAYAVGNPYGVLYSSVTKGIVSSLQRNYPMLGMDDQGDHGLMQISSGIIGGNSGGAVYNEEGNLIGVPVRGSPINEIVGLAVPLSDIKGFLKTNNIEVKCK